MIRLWLSRNNDVPLREQMATQIMLAVISQDLKPGERLASTRQIARRYRIHANTVSAAYGDLVRRGWLERRRGSGVYVRELSVRDRTLHGELDQGIAGLLTAAARKGQSLANVRRTLERWLEILTPRSLLVVEPEPELRDILVQEITEGTGLPVAGTGLEPVGDLKDTTVVAMYGRAERVRAVLPRGASCHLLRLSSMAPLVAKAPRLGPQATVAVISHSQEVRHWARDMAAAAGLQPGQLALRDPRDPGWFSGLETYTVLIADVKASKVIPARCRSRLLVLRLVAESSLEAFFHHQDTQPPSNTGAPG
jgi:GntR family transcriptional regulator